MKEIGVQKGDRVTIYLTMIPELHIPCWLAQELVLFIQLRFWGFLSQYIAGRINDCKSDYVVTADEGIRGGKTIHLNTIDEALMSCPNVKKCHS